MSKMIEKFELRSDGRASNKRYSAGLVVYMMVVGMLSGRKDVIGVYRMMQGLEDEELDALGVGNRRFFPKMVQFFNILNNIDEQELTEMFNKFVCKTEEGGEYQQICIDGKRLRGSRVGEVRGVHIIEAFAEEIRQNISQEVMAPDEDEVGAAMRILGCLELKDKVITADAIYTKPKFLKKIKEQGGEFLVAVKGNNKTLKRKLEASFKAEDEGKKNISKTRKTNNKKRNANARNGRKSPRQS